MPYVIVPQKLVDVLAGALATDPNMGAVLAEQVLRSSIGDVVQKLVGQPAGTAVAAGDRAQLPPLVSNQKWDAVADQLRAAAV